MREIVTLQFGSFSNHVATHFWNLTYPQGVDNSEFDGSVLYHRGEVGGRQRDCPRTIIFDKKGSLGALSELTGEFCERIKIDTSKPPDLPSWSHKTKLCQNSSSEPSENCTDMKGELRQEVDGRPLWRKKAPPALDGKVKRWTEFVKAKLHPKSIHLLHGVHSDATPFHSFERGVECCSRVTDLDEMLDRVRFFVEASDCIQGFHVLCDTIDSFGGLASRFMMEIKDDYRAPQLTFPLAPLLPKDLAKAARLNSLCNNSLVFDACLQTASFTVPLNANWWDYPNLPLLVDQGQNFHISGIAAAALVTATFPQRLRNRTKTITEISGQLRIKSQMKIGHLMSSFPVEKTLPSVVESYDNERQVKLYTRPIAQGGLRSTKVFSNLTRQFTSNERRCNYSESLNLQGFGTLAETDRRWMESSLNNDPVPISRFVSQADEALTVPTTFPFRDELPIATQTACAASIFNSSEITGLVDDAMKSIKLLRTQPLPGSYLNAAPSDQLRETAERLECFKDSYLPYE